MKETWTYCVPYQGETLECSGRDIEVRLVWEDSDVDNAEVIASDDVAEHYWTHCDGWEDAWPVTFRLRSPRGLVFDVEVDMETVPSFSSGNAKEVTDEPVREPLTDITGCDT